MKLFFSLLLCSAAFLTQGADFRPAARSPRSISIGKQPLHRLRAGNFEIVCRNPKCSVTRFAAEELAEFLGQTLKCTPTVLLKPSGKKIVIYVGASDSNEVKKLDRDGFYIRSKGRDIEIAGHDERGNPERSYSTYARGTLFGVYDFLERFAGVRYYFPGDMGTVAPPAQRVAAPSH